MATEFHECEITIWYDPENGQVHEFECATADGICGMDLPAKPTIDAMRVHSNTCPQNCWHADDTLT